METKNNQSRTEEIAPMFAHHSILRGRRRFITAKQTNASNPQRAYSMPTFSRFVCPKRRTHPALQIRASFSTDNWFICQSEQTKIATAVVLRFGSKPLQSKENTGSGQFVNQHLPKEDAQAHHTLCPSSMRAVSYEVPNTVVPSSYAK